MNHKSLSLLLSAGRFCHIQHKSRRRSCEARFAGESSVDSHCSLRPFSSNYDNICPRSHPPLSLSINIPTCVVMWSLILDLSHLGTWTTIPWFKSVSSNRLFSSLLFSLDVSYTPQHLSPSCEHKCSINSRKTIEKLFFLFVFAFRWQSMKFIE